MSEEPGAAPDHIAITSGALRRIAGWIISAIGFAVVATAWFYINVMGAIKEQAYGMKTIELGQQNIAATLDANHAEAQQRSAGLQNQVLELRAQVFEILHERKR